MEKMKRSRLNTLNTQVLVFVPLLSRAQDFNRMAEREERRNEKSHEDTMTSSKPQEQGQVGNQECQQVTPGEEQTLAVRRSDNQDQTTGEEQTLAVRRSDNQDHTTGEEQTLAVRRSDTQDQTTGEEQTLAVRRSDNQDQTTGEEQTLAVRRSDNQDQTTGEEQTLAVRRSDNQDQTTDEEQTLAVRRSDNQDLTTGEEQTLAVRRSDNQDQTTDMAEFASHQELQQIHVPGAGNTPIINPTGCTINIQHVTQAEAGKTEAWAIGLQPTERKSMNPNSAKGITVCKCIEFLKTATATGGKTARRSPNDPGGFQQSSGQRKDLYPEFVRCLERLRAAETYTDDSAMESLLTVCKMSDLTDTELADELAERGYPELFVKIWQGVYHADIYTSPKLARRYVVYNLLKQATISFTHVSWKLSGEMANAKHGIIPLMAKEFQHPLMTKESLGNGISRAMWNSPRETLKKMVNIMANIIRMNLDCKPMFLEANVVPYLQELLHCRFLIMHAKAFFTLVYVLNEDENEKLNMTDGNVKFVLKVLGKCLNERSHYSEHYTFSAEVVVQGIFNMAVMSDSNKVNLVENGVMPRLISMLKTESVAEKRIAAQAVWKLSSHEDNKKRFKTDTTLITVLKELQSSETDQKLVQTCKAVLWMLDVALEDDRERSDNGKRPSTAKKPRTSGNGENNGDVEVQSLNGDNVDDDMPDVMISYQRGVQKEMIKVKELLRASGFNVWMDVDDMVGSTLESKASAMERSAVVLTEKHKQSPSCRTEAEYTYKLQKATNPDGAGLGIMIGTKLYVDLSRPDTLEEDVNKLKQQLGDRARVLKDGTGTLMNLTVKSTKDRPQDFSATSGDHKMSFQRMCTHRRSTNAQHPGAQDHIDAKMVSSWSNDQVKAWLAKHGLGDLDRFDGYSGQRLLGLKTIATDAPDFFYAEIKRDLGFKSLLEIVTFKQALDQILVETTGRREIQEYFQFVKSANKKIP